MKKYIIVTCFLSFLLSQWLCGQASKIVLDNGLTLIHVEKRNIGLVSVDLFIKGGAADEADKEAGITNIIFRLLTKGTATRTSEQIANDSEMLGATISAGCSDDFSEVTMIVPSDNFISAFDIFADVVNNPTFPEKEFDKEKVRIIAEIKSKPDHIFSQTYDYFNQLIFKNRRYHNPDDGYEATVSSLTAAQVSDNYRKLYKMENMVLCIGGDIDFDLTQRVVGKYFGNIKVIEITKQIKKTKKEQKKKEQYKPSAKTYTGKFQQSYIFTGFLAPDISQKEYTALKMANTVLSGGMGSRLFNALRENNGLVYESHSFYPSRKETSDFVLYGGTSKENVLIVENIFNDEIKKLPDVSDEELENAKQYLKGTYLMDHTTIQRQVWWLGWWEVMGRGFGYDRQYIEDIDSVSPRDIKTACTKFLKPGQATTVILK